MASQPARQFHGLLALLLLVLWPQFWGMQASNAQSRNPQSGNGQPLNRPIHSQPVVPAQDGTERL
ncbi:MAG: hypothetical protein HC825_00940 [Oscillatoriales cyanobacterium RM1_1_9]|nr:hypothetical protein [Oscillatoriales cyanobacterium RM1_1_9]